MTSLRDQLLTIRDQHGALTPRLVVDEARDESHPLHTRFEWDDSVAGEKYRQQQAHDLIQVVRLTFTDRKGTERSVRAFHALRGEDGYSYEPAETVAADPVLSQVLLMDMQREWKSLQARYGHFSEFVRMVQEDVA